MNLSSNAVLKHVTRLVSPHHAKIVRQEPLRFEDIRRGMTFKTPLEKITKFRFDLYKVSSGVEWQHLDSNYAKEKNLGGIVVSSPLVIQIAEAHLSKLGALPIRLLKSANYPKFEKPVLVGDKVRTETTVLWKKRHKDPSKDYYYLRVRQDVFNHKAEKIFSRFVTYLVDRQK